MMDSIQTLNLKQRKTGNVRYESKTHTHKQMSETQSPEVVLVSWGTDSISAVLDTGNDFCQSHLYCNYDMIITYFIIYVGKTRNQRWIHNSENMKVVFICVCRSAESVLL